MKSRAPDSLVAASAFILACLMFFAGMYLTNPDTRLGWNARGLRSRISPPGARILDVGRVHESQARWTFAIHEAWPTYRRWVCDRLRPDFRVSSSDSDSAAVECVRYRDRETQSLRIETMRAAAGTTVQATFTLGPLPLSPLRKSDLP
jgi:hypothetical protein